MNEETKKVENSNEVTPAQAVIKLIAAIVGVIAVVSGLIAMASM